MNSPEETEHCGHLTAPPGEPLSRSDGSTTLQAKDTEALGDAAPRTIAPAGGDARSQTLDLTKRIDEGYRQRQQFQDRPLRNSQDRLEDACLHRRNSFDTNDWLSEYITGYDFSSEDGLPTPQSPPLWEWPAYLSILRAVRLQTRRLAMRSSSSKFILPQPNVLLLTRPPITLYWATMSSLAFLDGHVPADEDSSIYKASFLSALHSAWATATTFNVKRSSVYKKQHDLSVSVGDRVHLRNFVPTPGRSPKLCFPWLGQFRVIAVDHPHLTIVSFVPTGLLTWANISPCGGSNWPLKTTRSRNVRPC
ncbi:unnamed protein product [Heligmosomoides polygyrus]|uniref:Uncharacterized protein n=1 Tax=Heligmosomoides polygyrus TaxID=6339 RepID=A0A3P8H3R2_HELPZ|nr:unnamed protein product [Heligmosomoides polygyrus]